MRLTPDATASRMRIGAVLSLTANKQVTGINAAPIIAIVPYHHALRNRPVRHLERIAMCVHQATAFAIKAPIANPVCGPKPIPAFVWLANLYLRKKLIRQLPPMKKARRQVSGESIADGQSASGCKAIPESTRSLIQDSSFLALGIFIVCQLFQQETYQPHSAPWPARDTPQRGLRKRYGELVTLVVRHRLQRLREANWR
jgi:hypothetical protein